MIWVLKLIKLPSFDAITATVNVIILFCDQTDQIDQVSYYS